MKTYREESLATRNYMKVDTIIENMTPEELADYLLHNYDEFAEELLFELSMQIIVNEGEK